VVGLVSVANFSAGRYSKMQIVAIEGNSGTALQE
jgi:hypothetical protein